MKSPHRALTVSFWVPSFVTFNILPNGNVKFCMYQQIFLLRHFNVMSIYPLVTTAEEKKSSSTFIEKAMKPLHIHWQHDFFFFFTLIAYFSIWFPFCLLITRGVFFDANLWKLHRLFKQIGFLSIFFSCRTFSLAKYYAN